MPKGVYQSLKRGRGHNPNEVKPPRMGCRRNGYKPCWEYCPYPNECKASYQESIKDRKEVRK